MKNVMICASALLAAGMAFAQPPKDVVTQQTKQAVAPSAAMGGNQELTQQYGSGNDDVVYQVGTMNTSYIEQTGTNLTNRNLAVVLQTGLVGARSGLKNYADLMQNGEGNDMFSLQFGDKNTTFGSQVGNDNSALMQQGSEIAQQGEKNYADVSQTGNNNIAETQQRFDNNEATSEQVSTGFAVGNRSYQEQISATNGSNGHTAISRQYGGNNEVRQFQTGPDSNVGNYAEANQGDVSGTATGAYAQQIQSGSGQEAYIDQKLKNDRAFQEQEDKNNVAQARQNLVGDPNGGDNLSSQYQVGKRNDALTIQNGNDHIAFQEQYGNDNVAFTRQFNGQSGGNQAYTIQNGDGNNSSIKQSYHNNFALVDQIGSGHMSTVEQNISGTLVGSAPLVPTNTALIIQRNPGDTSGLQSFLRTSFSAKAGSLSLLGF